MARDWTPLDYLTNEEIVSRHYSSLDPLTTSDVEIELAQRLAAVADVAELYDDLVGKLHDVDENSVETICKTISESEIEASEIAGCIEALDEAGIETAADLKKLLAAAAEISKLELA